MKPIYILTYVQVITIQCFSNYLVINIYFFRVLGEVIWSVNACEVEKKHPQKLTANIPSSGRYYIVVEKVDKIYGGLREISVSFIVFCYSIFYIIDCGKVTATLNEPIKECTLLAGDKEEEEEKEKEKDKDKNKEKTRSSLVASVVVGGVKLRPMKWKSPVFIAPGISLSSLYLKLTF